MPERDLSLSMAVWSHEHLTKATLLSLLRIRFIALLSRRRLDASCYCRSLGNEPCRLWMNSFWTRPPAMHEDCLSSTDTDKKKRRCYRCRSPSSSPSVLSSPSTSLRSFKLGRLCITAQASRLDPDRGEARKRRIKLYGRDGPLPGFRNCHSGFVELCFSWWILETSSLSRQAANERGRLVEIPTFA